MQVRRLNGAMSRCFTVEGMFRSYLENRLDLFEYGSLRLDLPNGTAVYHSGAQAGPAAIIRVQKWKLLRLLMLEGEIGLARGFVEGDWSTPDLAAVIEFGLANEMAVTAQANGLSIVHLSNRVRHFRNANTRAGSRRNIAAHYDLGNRFYAMWLDRDLSYSSAIFDNEAESLEMAQDRKTRRVLELLNIGEGEHVLEIGCGWGGLAKRIAQAGAQHVTGISLSTEQIQYARDRLTDTSLKNRISFELCDYRSVTESYDRIVSIEMFEAVGERYWPVFFRHLRKALKHDGCAVLQIITIADDWFESYRRRPDFIQQYIFPGGMLPTIGHVERHAMNSGFQVESYEPFGKSYAQTLENWKQRFNAAWPDISRLDFDDRFRRMWNYYLTYCAVGFRRGAINVGLFKLVAVD